MSPASALVRSSSTAAPTPGSALGQSRWPSGKPSTLTANASPGRICQAGGGTLAGSPNQSTS